MKNKITMLIICGMVVISILSLKGQACWEPPPCEGDCCCDDDSCMGCCICDPEGEIGSPDDCNCTEGPDGLPIDLGECKPWCRPQNCRTCDGLGGCLNNCMSYRCESCDGSGNCLVCGDDPNFNCCDSNCCYKIWTKDTEHGSNIPCAGCEGGNCSGSTREIDDYDFCKTAATGSGEHCQCFETLQIVGKIYPCKRNWDCGHFFECLFAAVGCGVVCGATTCDPVPADEALCFTCLGGAGALCLDPCGYIEACEKDTRDPNNITDVNEMVFSEFGC